MIAHASGSDEKRILFRIAQHFHYYYFWFCRSVEGVVPGYSPSHVAHWDRHTEILAIGFAQTYSVARLTSSIDMVQPQVAPVT